MTIHSAPGDAAKSVALGNGDHVIVKSGGAAANSTIGDGLEQAPPSPPNGPSDWRAAVQGNRFSDIQRLGRWTGGTQTVPARTDPSSRFLPIDPQSIGEGGAPPTIYVLAHGWAPGYRDAVNAKDGKLLWWGRQASANGRWASDWAWSGFPPRLFHWR